MLTAEEGSCYFCFVWVSLSHQMPRSPMTVCSALSFTQSFFCAFFKSAFFLTHLHVCTSSHPSLASCITAVIAAGWCKFLVFCCKDMYSIYSINEYASVTRTVSFSERRSSVEKKNWAPRTTEAGGSVKAPSSEQEVKLPFLDTYSFFVQAE